MDAWKTTAAVATVKRRGRLALALVTDDGILHAGAYDAGADEAEALIDAILLLAHHPDLRMVGVDLMTTSATLRKVLTDGRDAGPHVTALQPHEYRGSDGLLFEARRAAEDAAEDAGSVVLVAATDGARDLKAHRDPLAGPGQTTQLRGGWGWVTEDGAYGYGHRRFSSALEAELFALTRLLESTTEQVPLRVQMDSLAAITLARTALAELDPSSATTKATCLLLARIRCHAKRDITLVHVKGHAGHDLNETAHALSQFGKADVRGGDENIAALARRKVQETLGLPEKAARAA